MRRAFGAAYGTSCVGCCIPMIGVMFVASMATVVIVISRGAMMVILKSSAAGPRVAQLPSLSLIAAIIATGVG
jgi:predicted metal-binding membrane protein